MPPVLKVRQHPSGHGLGLFAGRDLEVADGILAVPFEGRLIAEADYDAIRALDPGGVGARLDTYSIRTPVRVGGAMHEAIMHGLDDTGRQLKYAHCPAYYVNEPGPGVAVNATLVATASGPFLAIVPPVRRGREIVVYYGDGYARDYAVDTNAAHGAARVEAALEAHPGWALAVAMLDAGVYRVPRSPLEFESGHEIRTCAEALARGVRAAIAVPRGDPQPRRWDEGRRDVPPVPRELQGPIAVARTARGAELKLILVTASRRGALGLAPWQFALPPADADAPGVNEWSAVAAGAPAVVRDPEDFPLRVMRRGGAPDIIVPASGNAHPDAPVLPAGLVAARGGGVARTLAWPPVAFPVE